MRVINLASGSDGNVTYIESDGKRFLCDIGLSCSETTARLSAVGISPNQIDGIIISHEHSDHIKGVDIFSSKFDLPVFAHEKVWLGLDDKLKKVKSQNRKIFDGTFEIGDMTITPFEVPHDVSCFGYSFLCQNQKISIVTDLGHVTDRIINEVSGSQIVYIEANYDKDMLYNGTKYPLALKRRIDGPNGHLSNAVSADAIYRLCDGGTRQIVLSHLSKENNRPELAYNYICEKLQGVGIIEGENIRIDVASPSIGAFFRIKSN